MKKKELLFGILIGSALTAAGIFLVKKQKEKKPQTKKNNVENEEKFI